MLPFLHRILLIAVFWALIWRLIEPRTRLMRILRAVMLVLGLMAILTIERLAGG